nr:unnamed protein product [Spirometra erinaceieuropaei]
MSKWEFKCYVVSTQGEEAVEMWENYALIPKHLQSKTYTSIIEEEKEEEEEEEKEEEDEEEEKKQPHLFE